MKNTELYKPTPHSVYRILPSPPKCSPVLPIFSELLLTLNIWKTSVYFFSENFAFYNYAK